MEKRNVLQRRQSKFADDLIVCLRESKNSNVKLVQLLKTYRKVAKRKHKHTKISDFLIYKRHTNKEENRSNNIQNSLNLKRNL